MVTCRAKEKPHHILLPHNLMLQVDKSNITFRLGNFERFLMKLCIFYLFETNDLVILYTAHHEIIK